MTRTSTPGKGESPARPYSPDAPLVDVHAHIYHASMPLSATAWKRPAGEAKCEDYLATLDRAGVHFGVLAAASIFEDYNDYMIEAVRRHRRLRTTVIVSPEIGWDALRALHADGVVGIRLQFRSTADLPDLSGFAYRKLFRRLADLDMHVQLHDEGARLPQSIALIEPSGVKLVIDHFGRPDLARGADAEAFLDLLRAVERGRTWVKLSAAFRLRPLAALQPFADRLLAVAGPERLFWGSDWPFVAHESEMSYATALGDHHALFPDPAIRAAIDRAALKFYFS
jgi:predicted TIM-barrel fold metal-dependent hydrolase